MSADHSSSLNDWRRASKRCWIALPVAVLANALLFCLLAGARAEPPRRRVTGTAPIHVTVVEPPGSSGLKANVPHVARDDVALMVQEETLTALAEPLPALAAVPTMALPSRLDATGIELPEFSIVLPGASDLNSLSGAPVSQIEGPLSLAAVDRVPRRTGGADLQYPQWARQARLEATITLRFIVTPEGKVTNIHVHSLLGDERLGREAARTVATWQFEPAGKRGKSVACWCFQKVSFRLDD